MSASRAKAESFPGDGSNATDDEYEEEEQLVLVELTGIIDSDILEKCGNKCKILGINTENPFLQLDKYVFAGEYEDTLGTCVIFEEVLEQGKACYKKDKGDGENPKPQLKYKCHTAKKLNMTRTFLTEKKECDEDGGKVEWFQIKDDNDSTMPNMICSFVQESEVEDAENGSLSEEETVQLNTSTEDSGNLNQSFDTEKQDIEMDEPTQCQQDEQETKQTFEHSLPGDQADKTS
ncbi:Hypothetical predicted protein [Pelobates cultripes]|uniref:General transcription factor 3C polypeptide 6 n=1 Tax=Pelobates cultripes TaxID=61616 RepID=A0AAD1RNX8_PELCU|nr:Hypothetical predicted protein [Pelobates cultripes]